MVEPSNMDTTVTEESALAHCRNLGLQGVL